MDYIEEIIDYTIDGLEYMKGNDTYVDDIHHELFNTDYYIIGTYKAEQWLKNGPGIFEAMSEIKEYESINFGMTTTDLTNPEKIVNMYVYILGEKILNRSDTYRRLGMLRIDDDTIDEIIEDISTNKLVL